MLVGERLLVCGWCGEALSRDLHLPEPLPEMVQVPAGVFLMGSPENAPIALEHEKPRRKIYLSSYSISRHPVTNGSYREFVKDSRRNTPAHWEKRPPLGANAKHPVCFVNWEDALAYCAWLSKITGAHYTLPTEAQWEKAARGGFWLDGDDDAGVRNEEPGRIYPHGNTPFEASYGNFAGLEGGTTIVGSFPKGASPYGCLDMAGNVSEWCLDTYNPTALNKLDDRNPLFHGNGIKVLKGGSWRSEAAHVRCANRYFYDAARTSYGIGFRVVRTE